VRILFVHCNYPAQFCHLSKRLAADHNHEIVFLCQNKEWTASDVSNLRLSRYQLGREPKHELCHPYLRRYETAVLHGQAALREALRLRQDGFAPDLIIGHSGFGNTLYLKEVWPNAKFIGYFEWFYRSQGSDVGFGNNQPPSPDTSLRVHTYNSPIVMDLAQADAAICPTRWQANQFPPAMRQHLSVIFDGVDTDQLPLVEQNARHNPLNLGDGGAKARIPADVPLITYVTRCFEPYRGWPQVAEGLALLLQRNPRAHILLVGSDEVAYGAKRGDGLSWREWALKQWPMDPSRLHQLPALSYGDYKRVIQRSWVHVYWTVPFILSWSLMEAMASGCCIVASATPPVEEMITSGDQGQLVDFFDPDALAQQADHLLQDREQRQRLGKCARQHILEGGYDLQNALKQQVNLINQVIRG
jgi:glycosyltransferase involved in cell wall biosynthesis